MKKIREMKVDWWLGGDKWVLVIHSGLPIPICHILVPNPLSFHEFFHRFLQDQWKFVIMLAISKNEYNEDLYNLRWFISSCQKRCQNSRFWFLDRNITNESQASVDDSRSSIKNQLLKRHLVYKIVMNITYKVPGSKNQSLQPSKIP